MAQTSSDEKLSSKENLPSINGMDQDEEEGSENDK